MRVYGKKTLISKNGKKYKKGQHVGEEIFQLWERGKAVW